jgi:hypothetical protein
MLVPRLVRLRLSTAIRRHSRQVHSEATRRHLLSRLQVFSVPIVLQKTFGLSSVQH